MNVAIPPPRPTIDIIIPNWLIVEYAKIPFKSYCLKAVTEPNIIVIKPTKVTI